VIIHLFYRKNNTWLNHCLMAYSSLLLCCRYCCCLGRATRDKKADQHIGKSIADHFHSGLHHLCERNITRYVSFWTDAHSYIGYKFFQIKIQTRISYVKIRHCWRNTSFRTGGVGIARMVKRIERKEYMGFENICS